MKQTLLRDVSVMLTGQEEKASTGLTYGHFKDGGIEHIRVKFGIELPMLITDGVMEFYTVNRKRNRYNRRLDTLGDLVEAVEREIRIGKKR